MKYIFISLILLVSLGYCGDDYYYRDGKKRYLNKLNQEDKSIDYYTTTNGTKIGVKDTLLVKFKNTKNLEKYKKDYNLTQIEELFENLYLFKIADKNKTLDIANKLYEKEDIEYSHPNFIKQRILR